jgi:hypothetical protein
MAQYNRESRHTIGGYRHRRVLREIREQQLLDDAEGVSAEFGYHKASIRRSPVART